MSTPRSNAEPPAETPAGRAALLRASAEGGLWLPADGESMLPTIPAGSRVRVQAVARTPRLAEIWAFCGEAGQVIVHRFRMRDGAGRHVFRGDNMTRRDPPVDTERLVGVVTIVEYGGRSRRLAAWDRVRWLADQAWCRVAGTAGSHNGAGGVNRDGPAR